MSDVVVDGIRLDPPLSLTYEEVRELAEFNGEVSRRRAHHPETIDRMKQLQLRFNWLGYFSGDGEHHGGPNARPTIVTVRPATRRWWLMSGRARREWG